MKTPATFTIVTPSFNQGKFIAKTIESALTQPGDFYIDYIIMDGGSTDETVVEIKKYEKLLQDNCRTTEQDGITYYVSKSKDFKFNSCLGISYRWQSQSDKGQSDALNKGFALGVGDIFAWLNSDDYYTENALQTALNSFATSGADVIVGNTIALDGNDKPLWLQKSGKPSLFKLLFVKETPAQPAVFFTAEIFKAVGGVDENLHYTMDWDLWIRFCFQHAQFLKTWDYLAIQVYHQDSKSLQGDSMFEKFAPENNRMGAIYRRKLGLLKCTIYQLRLIFIYRPYIFLRSLGGEGLPQPVKDVLNKIIARLKK